ncbi:MULTISPECIES: hypothetical protein [Prochlorococcus]|uniref:hypothetical protein n=1 Tax=Prochlorococcus TaxID=1218 RepID=UPI000533A4EA|nr:MULTISPECIES: hypothetical protein [Prochlorococcus]KGG12801.1 hypothetical protein EV05_0472 [Prochlorococcus sp. MIT 0601]
MDKKSSGISKTSTPWLWKWSEPESVLTVIPKSKTQRLAKQAKLANVDAEKAINRAYQQELLRVKAIGEAMFKSGKAVRYTFASSGRQLALRVAGVTRRLRSWVSNS